jgi:formylglycine-generating enzyme required for sulfatase activity
MAVWCAVVVYATADVRAERDGFQIARRTAGVAATPERPSGEVTRIKGGSYRMGCQSGDDQCEADERPGHRVKVHAFWLDVHEVTVAEYGECVAAGVCQAPRPTTAPDDPGAATWNRSGFQRHPINSITWEDAYAFCHWKGKRLPSEAEFEWALRGGQEGRVYPWGNAPHPPANFGNLPDLEAETAYPDLPIFDNYRDGFARTAPVCSFAQNPLGLCDIAGNVAEYVEDYYDPAWYQHSPNDDPLNEKPSQSHVVRGGAFKAKKLSWHRVSFRDYSEIGQSRTTVGFRCARN